MIALILGLWLATPSTDLPAIVPEDLDRFPQRYAARDSWDLARRYTEWLQGHPPLDYLSATDRPAHEQEADYCRRAWDRLDNAQRATEAEWGSPAAVVYELDRLREIIGPEAYYRGEMPPPIPLQYLRFFP